MTDTAFAKRERELELRKLENEKVGIEAETAEKKALIAEAKAKYGSKWKKILGMAKGLAPNSESLQTLYSMGMNSDELRDLTRPNAIKRYRE